MDCLHRGPKTLKTYTIGTQASATKDHTVNVHPFCKLLPSIGAPITVPIQPSPLRARTEQASGRKSPGMNSVSIVMLRLTMTTIPNPVKKLAIS